jgi:endonuclease III
MTVPKALDWDVILDRLSAFYHTGDWRVPYLREHAENPFQVLIGTILSQRTRDANTDRASALLFAKYPGPKELADASTTSLEKLIRSTGYFRTKARHIRATSKAILERFEGRVPADRELLLSLPGVGPKTANCVLVFGYGMPAVPVDTHVHRIANRLGLVRTKTPEQTEAEIVQKVPPQYWIPLNPLLVQHGQNICRPNRPLCPECPIIEYCATGLALQDGRIPPRREDRPRPPQPRTRREASGAHRVGFRVAAHRISRR